MKIKIEKSDDCYRADCLDCPGSPPVGMGRTKLEALASLFYSLKFFSTGGTYPTNWFSYINKDDPIVINRKPYNRRFKQKV